MRTFFACLFAGILGSLFTMWLLERAPLGGNPAVAQRPEVLPAPTVPVLPPVPASTLPVAQGEFRRDWYNAEGLTDDEAVGVAVYEQCNRSVVNISTLSVRADRFFMMAVPEEGNGSGAILDQTGHILTNYHVIEGARLVRVTLFNEESYDAELVGADPVNDIAVIKINAPAESLFPVALGDSSTLKVGMKVFALGNPFGLERTMSVGIISSLNRTLEVQRNWVIKSIIQIDASINPGNSGGPLIDSRGQLIGMNTAIASRVDQSAGIGFAIPINLVKRVVPELIQHGRVIRGDIGITHVTVMENGLRIAELAPGGAAEKAGLLGPKIVRRGPLTLIDRGVADIIVAVDGKPVTSAAEFLGFLEGKKPGDVVEVSVLREDQVLSVKITLGGNVGPNGPKTNI